MADPTPEGTLQGLAEELFAELREAAEWFGDEEHGEPLTSDTVPAVDPAVWLGYVDPETGDPRFQISERSYVAICAALDLLDKIEELNA